MIPSKEEKISFHYEDIQFILPNHLLIVDWIYKTIINETKILRQVNYIFCSDNYLHKINLEYLNHDTFTDVILLHKFFNKWFNIFNIFRIRG